MTLLHNVLYVTKIYLHNAVIRGHLKPQRNATCPNVAYTTVSSLPGDQNYILAKKASLADSGARVVCMYITDACAIQLVKYLLAAKLEQLYLHHIQL